MHPPAQMRSTRVFKAPIDAVWHLVRDQPGHARWFPGMTSVEALPAGPSDGTVWRHRLAYTALRIRVREVGQEPGSPIEWCYSDERGYMQGTWRFSFETEPPDGCRVIIDELSTVNSWLTRLWLRLWLRPGHYADKYLGAIDSAIAAAR